MMKFNPLRKSILSLFDFFFPSFFFSVLHCPLLVFVVLFIVVVFVVVLVDIDVVFVFVSYGFAFAYKKA